MAASATANKTPSGTPTYMPILLSPVEDDVEEDAAEACDVSIGWPIVVVVARLDAEAPWDVAAEVPAIRADGTSVETMLICATVYTIGSAALKTRSLLLQHVVLMI
jgi:hypothetical protein